VLASLPHLYSGKVRDVYAVDADLVLMVASDRISAFDHVLPTPVPDKGIVLTRLSAWWFDRLAPLGPHHFVSLDDPRIPADVRGRAMLCRRLAMVPVECVARGYLAGSALVEYTATGSVCGIALPAGLEEGSRLTEPVFTPATKAAAGSHDENVTFAAVTRTVGAELAQELRSRTLAVYAVAEGIATERGVVLADTKLEFGHDPDTGVLVLGDEVLTPDSSRLWLADGWAPGRAQPSFDKQFVRDWLTSPASGWDRASGSPPPPLPEEVIAATRARYVEAYERITGEQFA
jgi:phosphoribosylaminoimidazole-succinocarboxamide synthase